jgi:hypothetical protein
MSLPNLLTDRGEYQERLRHILPASLTGTTSTANEAAAAAAFVLMYVGAIDRRNPVRPTTIVWMSDEIAARRSAQEREAYYAAAMRSERAVKQLCAAWNVHHSLGMPLTAVSR